MKEIITFIYSHNRDTSYICIADRCNWFCDIDMRPFKSLTLIKI